MARNLLLSHLTELPILRAFKNLPVAEQRRYNDFKKKWLTEHDKVRVPKTKFKQAQEDKKDGVLAKTDADFKKLDAVRKNLQDKAKE